MSLIYPPTRTVREEGDERGYWAVEVSRRDAGAGAFTFWSTPLRFWHLLSMDAPTVALCWTLFTATITHTRISVASGAAMWLVVWILYAADRLMDTRHLVSMNRQQMRQLEARHLFHHHHRNLFSLGIIVALLLSGALLTMLPLVSLRLFAVEGVFMAGYFALVHVKDFPRGRLPKELLVGPFFAAAVFIPTVSQHPDLRWELLPLAILFGALCSLNCLSIFAWEHPECSSAPVGTGWLVQRLGRIVWWFAGVSILMCLWPIPQDMWPMSFRLYSLACAGGGAALGICGLFGHGLSRTMRRAAADLCLLTPLLVFPFLRYG